MLGIGKGGCEDTGVLRAPKEMVRFPDGREEGAGGVSGEESKGCDSFKGEGIGDVDHLISSRPRPTSIDKVCGSWSRGVLEEDVVEAFLDTVLGAEEALLLNELIDRRAFNRRAGPGVGFSDVGEGGWVLDEPLSLPRKPLEAFLLVALLGLLSLT